MTEPKLSPPQAVGVKKHLFIAVGLFFVGVAFIGAITPGFPTVVWLIIASYFFSRSSPRLHTWLLNSRMFGGLLRDWEQHRGMRVKHKVVAVSMMTAACTCSILFADVPDWVRPTIAACGFAGFLTIVFLVRTVRTTAISG